MHTLIAFLVLAIATGTLSVTLTRGKIFRNQRKWIKVRSGFFGELLSCPYCTAHWVGFLAAGVIPPEPIAGHWLPDLIVWYFCLVGVAAAWIGLITSLIQFSDDELGDLVDALKKAVYAQKEENARLKKEIETLKH